jgi:hypothetical protein
MGMLHGQMLEFIAWSSIFFRKAPLSECPQRQESANNIPSRDNFPRSAFIHLKVNIV